VPALAFFVLSVGYLTLNLVDYGIVGLSSLDPLTLAAILLIVTGLLLLVSRVWNLNHLPRIRDPVIFLFGIIIIAGFSIPLVIYQKVDTRWFVYIDIGVALLLAFLASYLPRKRWANALVFLFVGACILLSQGLYQNWVVSGDIQESIYRYSSVHADEMKGYTTIYFNTTSFMENIETTPAHPLTLTFVELYHRTVKSSLEGQLSVRRIYEYTFGNYYNAKLLGSGALGAMLNRSLRPDDRRVLVYPQPPYVSREYSGSSLYPEELKSAIRVEEDLLAKNLSAPGGYYEINYSRVFPAGKGYR
jgi:hypothetical protein